MPYKTTAASTSAPAPAASSSSSLHLLELQRIEARLESCLVGLRRLRTELQRDAASKGVLGSRGLTQFLIEQLQVQFHRHLGYLGLTLDVMLARAEAAGYQVPTARTLSKRLTERAYRAGDIKFDPASQTWLWLGDSEEKSHGK